MFHLFSDLSNHLHLTRRNRSTKTRYPVHRRSYFDAAAEKRAADRL
jgi:hypothetical protein